MAVLLHTKEGEKGRRSKGVKSMVKSCFLSPWTWKRNERLLLTICLLQLREHPKLEIGLRPPSSQIRQVIRLYPRSSSCERVAIDNTRVSRRILPVSGSRQSQGISFRCAYFDFGEEKRKERLIREQSSSHKYQCIFRNHSR